MFPWQFNEEEEGKVTEQQEITDAIRGPEVRQENRTQSIVGWLLMTIQLPLINKIIKKNQIDNWNAEVLQAAPQTFLYKIKIPVSSRFNFA